MSAEPLLVARGVRKSFGGIVAVDVDELTVHAGQAVALIGPNGAGKTTLFDILTGFQRADAGSWSLGGRSMTGHSADRIARAGMVRTFQRPRLLPRATVLRNVELGASGHPGERLLLAPLAPAWRAEERRVTERARALLDQLGLGECAADDAGTLSGGQRKLLELARVLMCEPRVVMLDEPIAGVSPVLAERIGDHLRALRDQGTTLVFIEHNLGLVARVSDEVLCLADGRVIARGSAAGVAADPAVVDAYLGCAPQPQ